MSASGLKSRKTVNEPLAPGFVHVFPPTCYRCPFDKRYPDCGLTCAKLVGDVIEMEDPETVAAVMVEPGTPAGFATVLAARERFVREGARVIAPCPHSAACPMTGNDWCHFGARVERTALHRRVKGADLGYEDEKYAYVAVAGGGTEPADSTAAAGATRATHAAAPAAARIVRRPLIRHGHVILDLCTADGLVRTVVAKHDKGHYRAARKAHWGDAWAAFDPDGPNHAGDVDG